MIIQYRASSFQRINGRREVAQWIPERALASLKHFVRNLGGNNVSEISWKINADLSGGGGKFSRAIFAPEKIKQILRIFRLFYFFSAHQRPSFSLSLSVDVIDIEVWFIRSFSSLLLFHAFPSKCGVKKSDTFIL